jgi:DNA-directed RNA polymerase specialized sigma24 family protein
MTAQSGGATNHDQDDVDDAIAVWTDDDHLRMMARAAAAAVGTDLAPEDVLGEAVKLAMSGKRPWKVGVPFEAHMTMVMKGVGFNRRRSLKARPTVEIEAMDEGGSGYGVGVAEDALSGIHAKQLEADAQRVFADDAIGWAIFMARLVEQMSVEEACEFAGIPREQYETALKRVSRKLAKAVESGVIR